MRFKRLPYQIAYVGPAGSGKSSNVRALQAILPNAGLAVVDHDRKGSLPFAFECTTLGLSAQGVDLDLRIYSVPEKGISRRLRRQMIAQADGIVFVADSRSSMLDRNRQALEEVLDVLDGRETPLVMQWNRRDEANAAPVAALERMLNASGRCSSEATASRGQGVAWTLRSLVTCLLSPNDCCKTDEAVQLPPLDHNPLPNPEDIPDAPDIPFRESGFRIVRHKPHRQVPPVLFAAGWLAVAASLAFLADGVLLAFGAM